MNNPTKPSIDGGGLPLLDPSVSAQQQDHNQRICAVLLAAGSSERFGEQNKLTVPIAGEPMVRRSVAALQKSTVDQTAIVVGHDADAVRESIAGFPINIIYNQEYATGFGTSIRRGIEHACRIEADAVLISLADMPFVQPTTIDRLIAAYVAGYGNPLAPAYRGRRGNPVLFGQQYFEDLQTVDSDSGGRDVLLNSPTAALIATTDPGVIIDFDSPRDLDSVPDTL